MGDKDIVGMLDFLVSLFSFPFDLDQQHRTGYDTEMHNIMALVAGTEIWNGTVWTLWIPAVLSINFKDFHVRHFAPKVSRFAPTVRDTQNLLNATHIFGHDKIINMLSITAKKQP